MRRFVCRLGWLAGVVPVLAVAQQIDLETIMGNPDWIGHAVEAPYWSVDGQTIYYSLKRDGSPLRDLYRVDPHTGVSQRLSAQEAAAADGPAKFDRKHRNAAFLRHGVLFLRTPSVTAARQVSAPPQSVTAFQFSADGGALQYLQDGRWLSYELASATTRELVVLKWADDPAVKTQNNSLAQEQLHLFETLRQIAADRHAEQAEQTIQSAADPAVAPPPFWLGADRRLVDSSLSPDGHWLLLVTEDAHASKGSFGLVTHYVTTSGYARTEPARSYVGRDDPAPQSLLLLNLLAHQVYPLSQSDLPGIHDDPLKDLRSKALVALKKQGRLEQAKALQAPAQRAAIIAGDDEIDGGGVVWSADGQQAAIELRAIDNKDRWIASVDLTEHRLVAQHRLHDPAWINWNFNDFGWLPDGRTLWYLSEQSGWSQLYEKPLHGGAKALTQGHFELSAAQLSADGRWFYLLGNRQAPYDYDVYRVPAAGGALSQVTHYQGTDSFVLSPDSGRLAVLHSSAYRPSQLAILPAAGGTSRELTNTVKPAYSRLPWIQPQIVAIPSQHGAGVIYAKYYAAAGVARQNRPAVIFIHGAGYLQNVTRGYAAYFREQMFDNLLVRQGFSVLDLDYRASAGYGRTWRVAIYRQMGHPELEDLLDAKIWLTRQGVDPQRVGVYGGSYGGFMTLMALLRAPGQFAAGAALRPVADWRDYNHEYTSNILNDPQLDPKAYRISSPIDYAEHLQDPLLIEHGLIDNNVLPSDSIRLYQRFVELHKKNFWISLYPLERHGFVHPDDWYDEYRRIDELFLRYLNLGS